MPATNMTSAKPMSARNVKVGSSASSHPNPVAPRTIPASSSPSTIGDVPARPQGQQRADQAGRGDDRQAFRSPWRPPPESAGAYRLAQTMPMDLAGTRCPSSRSHDRTVLATRRRDGRPQMSPVNSGLVDGAVCISSRAPLAKVRNIRRDPEVSVLIFTKEFFGSWVQIDGRAEIVDQPEALDLLETVYRTIAGEHPGLGRVSSSDDSRRAGGHPDSPGTRVRTGVEAACTQ